MNNRNLCINFVPTGMVPTKQHTPHVPITPEEIAADVHSAWQIGISMVHLHGRDESGLPTSSAECYGRIIKLIREFAPELVICVSLSGRMTPDFRTRAEPLQLDGRLKPDMGSLTLSSLNFHQQASVNAPETIALLADAMKQRGIKPELEVFDTGMLHYSKYLIRKGLLSPPFYYNLILGNIASAQVDPQHVGILIKDLPENSLWSLGGIGESQFTANALAIACGGGVRVGLEDNIWLDTGRSRLATNLDLLRRIHELADIHERKLMTASELRQKLNLETT